MANSENFKITKIFDAADFGCCRMCCEPLPDRTAAVCPSCLGDPMRTRIPNSYSFTERSEMREFHRAVMLLKKVNGKIIKPDQYLEFNSAHRETQ